MKARELIPAVGPDSLEEINALIRQYHLSTLELSLSAFSKAKNAYSSALSAVTQALTKLSQSKYDAYDQDTIDQAAALITGHHSISNSALWSAIKSGMQFPVIRYLVEVVDYPCEFDRIMAAAYGENPGNLAYLQQLAAILPTRTFKATTDYDWIPVLKRCDFAVLDWLKSQGAPIHTWISRFLDCQPFSQSTRFIAFSFQNAEEKLKTVLAYYDRYMDELPIQDFTDTVFLCYQRTHPKQNYEKQFFSVINKALDKYYQHPQERYAYSRLMNNMSTELAQKLEIECLLRKGYVDQARNACLEIISRHGVGKSMAAEKLAELLLDNRVVIHEDNDPLKNYDKANVLKACYYLQDCKQPSAVALLRRCYEALAEPGTLRPSVQSCSAESMFLYKQYLQYRVTSNEWHMIQLNQSKPPQTRELSVTRTASTTASQPAVVTSEPMLGDVLVDQSPLMTLSLDALNVLCDRYGLIFLKGQIKQVKKAEENYELHANKLLDHVKQLRKFLSMSSPDTIAAAQALIARCSGNYVAVAIQEQQPLTVIRYLLQMEGLSSDVTKKQSHLAIAYETNPANVELMQMLFDTGSMDMERFCWEKVWQSQDFRMMDWLRGNGVDIFTPLLEYLQAYSSDAYNRKEYYRPRLSLLMDSLERYMKDMLAHPAFAYTLGNCNDGLYNVNDSVMDECFYRLLLKMQELPCQGDKKHYEATIARLHEILVSRDVYRFIRHQTGRMMQDQGIEATKMYCMNLLEVDPKASGVDRERRDKMIAATRVVLAELLLTHNTTLIEDSMALRRLPALGVMQAYYLLVPSTLAKADPVKQACHAALSDPAVTAPSEATWREEAKRAYEAYVLSKERPQDAMVEAMIPKLVASGLRLFKPQTVAPQVAASSSKKRLLASGP